MESEEPVLCPKCGVPMNFHAEKVDYAAALEGAAADPELGGVLERFHACPKCGAAEARRAEG